MSELSEKCRRILESPPTKDICYNFREIRRRAICGAWALMEEKKMSFRDAIRESWRLRKEECAKISAII
jgi:hypothetical protein